MSQSIRSWSFLFTLSLTLIVLGHLTLGREGLLLGLVISLGINSYVYFFEDRRILNIFMARPLEGQDPWGLKSLNHRLCRQLNISPPRLYILPDEAPQAMALGPSLNRGSIILTEGLLKRLTPEEVEAILADLLASIKNLNTLAFTAGSFFVSGLLAITESLDFVFRLLMVERKNPDQALSQFFTRAASPLVGLILRLSVRPYFYLEADHLASQLLKRPQNLAIALWKMESFSHTRPFTAPLFLSHMFVVNPLTQQSWTRYFHTQPSVEKRIRKLIGHYPM